MNINEQEKRSYRQIKKAIFTLCVDNYSPDITEITFPLIKAYARKIEAEFVVIKDRKFPGWPPVYEKLQIHQLGREMRNDWNIYIDADALVHPDMIDLTVVLHKDTVAHHGSDFASHRWRYDQYFLRDGRHIGSGNWLTLASDWCLDLWKPLEDLTLEEAVKNIFPTVDEKLSKCFDASHLIDDYTLSRNIARFGLKFQTVRSIMEKVGHPGLLWHQYLIPHDQKVAEMKRVLVEWRLV